MISGSLSSDIGTCISSIFTKQNRHQLFTMEWLLHDKLHSVPHNSNSLISNYRLFRRPPSTPKITPLAKLTLLQRKMAKICLSPIKSSAFKISSYAGPSLFCEPLGRYYLENSHYLYNFLISKQDCTPAIH